MAKAPGDMGAGPIDSEWPPDDAEKVEPNPDSGISPRPRVADEAAHRPGCANYGDLQT